MKTKHNLGKIKETILIGRALKGSILALALLVLGFVLIPCLVIEASAASDVSTGVRWGSIFLILDPDKGATDPFKFRPTHTLVLYTNHLPRVGASDSGIWRRLIVIPFNARITGSSDIRNYSKYLAANAGPAIMKWIIEGACLAIAGNYKLKIPPCVQAAIDRYRADNDWMSHFLEACCVVGDDCQEKSGELYSAYRAFCARTNDYCRSTTEFYTSLEQRGFSRQKLRDGRYILGLRLAEEEL